jgi:hypothetical protein
MSAHSSRCDGADCHCVGLAKFSERKFGGHDGTCSHHEHPRAGAHSFKVEAEFGDVNIAAEVDC